MRIISRDSVYPWQRKKGCLREALHTVLGEVDKFWGYMILELHWFKKRGVGVTTQVCNSFDSIL